jgi:hypothetical protein
MANRDGGDIYDFGNMTDDEVREVVLEHLRDSPNLDVDDIEVGVKDGTVVLSGRVGTDAEVRVAEAVLDDVLGLDSFSNELVVDELRRGDVPLATDDAERWEADHIDQTGGESSQQSDTAEHLVEDLDAETNGARDMGQAIRDGSAYAPPDRPVSDGYGSRENH